MRFITITTDFGTRDWFVGTMKGVVAAIAPRTCVIDLTHEIAPGDIRAGAFALAASSRFFPKGSVHLAVVDPGVGSSRRPLAVRTTNGFFVGPDNGVLSWALAKEEVIAIHVLTNQQYFLKPVSRTFHGRDIFAPVAAHLSRGISLKKLGPQASDFVRMPWPNPRVKEKQIIGQVLYIDRFGNALTNITADMLKCPDPAAFEVFQGRRRLCPVASFYQAVPVGKPVALIGSSGFLEIAVNGGNAANRLKLSVDTPVAVHRLNERQP